jgi:hypothetical protein
MRSYRVICDSPASEATVHEALNITQVYHGDNYLIFLRRDSVILSVPHSRVQYYKEIL